MVVKGGARVLKQWKVAMLGAGAIAEAMIDAFFHTGVLAPQQIHVVNRANKEKLLTLQHKYGVHASHNIEDAVAGADLILLCVKPKDAEEVLHHAAQLAPDDALYLSVVAGKSIDWMTKIIRTVQTERQQPQLPRVVRTMPNTSCVIRESATAYAVSANCTENDIQIVETLLRAIGTAYPMAENLLNAVTGLSGSGPAYFYYMVESLIQAGIDVGLDEKTAKSLVTQTIYGASHMLRYTGEAPEKLRADVTSPGGTTMAGIATLESHQFTLAVRVAVQSATQRAAELGE